MQKILVRSIPNHEATRKFAAQLCAEHLKPAGPFSLFLEGGLGAGKTFLVKEILQHLGVSDEVSSPTYALVNEYQVKEELRDKRGESSQLPTPNSPLKFCHWDFYRLEDENDFFARGFQDLAGQEQTSHFVEWPERLSPEAKASFSGQRFVLKIEFGIGVGMRRVKLLKTE